MTRPLTEVTAAGDSGLVQTSHRSPGSSVRTGDCWSLRWCASGYAGCATLTQSDSDGNPRARPSPERPLAAKAARSSDGRESTHGWAFRVYRPAVHPLLRGVSPALHAGTAHSILLRSDSNLANRGSCGAGLILQDGPRLKGASVPGARRSRTRPSAKAAPEGGGSGQDVVQRGREPLARFLKLALDVQARLAGLGPQVEEVGPAR